MKYKITYSSKFKKAYKKLNAKEQQVADIIINRLCNDEILEQKYKDYALKGEYIGFNLNTLIFNLSSSTLTL